MSDSNITKELGKADGHLQRLVYDCYKQLIIYQVADIKHTIKKFYSSYWLKIGDGELWRIYMNKYVSARKNEITAKQKESINGSEALVAYDLAYNDYQSVLDIFKKYKYKIYLSFCVKIVERITKGTYWLIVTFILAIIAVFVSYILG